MLHQYPPVEHVLGRFRDDRRWQIKVRELYEIGLRRFFDRERGTRVYLPINDLESDGTRDQSARACPRKKYDTSSGSGDTSIERVMI